METVLLILGVLGFGAVVIAVYVFTTAARDYVSNTHYEPRAEDTDDHERLYVVRSQVDRRQTRAANLEFPLRMASGETIAMDRRMQHDRRQIPAGH
jgi:hypothetical protein